MACAAQTDRIPAACRRHIDHRFCPLFVECPVVLDASASILDRLAIMRHHLDGVIVSGAPGTGKTQILKFWLSQWVKRPNTRLVVLDAGKGDMISGWPDEDFYLLAPADDRVQPGPDSLPQAMAWDIGTDLLDRQDAREFAIRTIPEGNDPQWAKGARAIVRAILVGLMERYGQDWGWRDLYDAVAQPDADLHAWVVEHVPEAASYVKVDAKGDATRNALGYINNFKETVLEFVEPLALAWGDVPKHRRLSIRRWMLYGEIAEGQPAAKTLLLARSGRMSSMSAAWIGGVLRLMRSIMLDAEMTEDPSRRILMVFDEYPTVAAKGDGFEEFKNIGRSKGIGIYLGLQSFQQIIKIWGDEEFASVDETIELKIIGKTSKTVAADKGAKAIAENLIGKGLFRRSRARQKDEVGPIQEETQERLIVPPEFFVANVGKSRKGLRAASPNS